jgi:hypothetical protein
VVPLNVLLLDYARFPLYYLRCCQSKCHFIKSFITMIGRKEMLESKINSDQ